MTDPWTEAWAEGMASVDPTVFYYCTLELRHPAFIEDGEPLAIRVVLDVQDRTLTLEPSAPMDGGQAVVFTATAFEYDMPEFGEGRLPEARVRIDNVARLLEPHIEAAAAQKADIVVSYREWRSDDTTAPCYGPLDFVMRRATVTGSSVEGYVRIDDLQNVRFPSRVYSRTQFPSLQ